MEGSLEPKTLWKALTRAAEQAEKAGRVEECLGLLRQAAKMAALSFGNQHHDYALSLIRLADGFLELGRLQDAEQYYVKAIPVLEQSLGETHMTVGIGYRNLAELYKMQGEHEKACSAMSRASSILQSGLMQE